MSSEDNIFEGAYYDYKGIVTNVDPTFLCFELDSTIKVHMSILMSQNKLQTLPLIGSIVDIKNAHKLQSSYFICKSSTVKGDFSLPCHEDTFLKLVQKYKFGINDLLELEGIVNLIQNNFKDLQQNLILNLINFFMRIFFSKLPHYDDDTCLNNNILRDNIITSSLCRYIEIQSDKFNDYPHWSFGIHSNPRRTLLFGHLIMHPIYGFLLLKDKGYQIPAIFYNLPPAGCSQIQDSYVSIDKYKVITEVYQESNVPNMEYLFIDFESVNIICAGGSPTHNCLFGNENLSEKAFERNMYFQLKRKSMIRIGSRNTTECWFQILILNINGKELFEEAFLILPSAYMKIVFNFTETLFYTLFYNTDLKVVNNMELTRVKKLKVYEIQENDAYFLKDDTVIGEEKILTVAECRNYILNNRDLVSFEGTLKSKRFTDALPSYTVRKTNIYGFGTPGTKIHQLVFAYTEDNVTKYLDCYLNNWENTLMPLGLIPQMRVVVRNVYPSTSKKYVRSSVFTTFEIISYGPLVPFDTVNLYENDHLDWGKRFFLGCGNKLPHGVLIWGIVTSVHILSLKITNQCAGCSGVKENLGKCVHCHQLTETQLQFLIKMHVSDEFGQSKVISKFPGIMKTILNLQEHQFQIWLKSIREIGSFEYNFFEDTQTFDSSRDEVTYFKSCLTNFVKIVNQRAMLFLHLKCRKIDTNLQTNGGRPFWICIDARKCC